MISKIIEDYQHKVVKFARMIPLRGSDIYLAYSGRGFGEKFLEDKPEGDFPSFYYKFENVSKRLARKIIDLVKNTRFTGIFSRDKAMLDELIQQNL